MNTSDQTMILILGEIKGTVANNNRMNTVNLEMVEKYHISNLGAPSMKCALIDNNDIVQNVIEYDGVSPYNPAPLILGQVNDWVNIGDHKDIAEPTP